MIHLDHKLASDGTPLHRFRCTACNRVGAWLERAEIAERNGQQHAALTHTVARL